MIEVLVSSTTFGFGLFLDAWQTLGLLFSYLNSVAIALMLAGVLYKVVQQDSHHKCVSCRPYSKYHIVTHRVETCFVTLKRTFGC